MRKWMSLLVLLLLLGGGAWWWGASRPGPGPVPVVPNLQAQRDAFEALVQAGRLPGYPEPRAGWVPAPARLEDVPPVFAGTPPAFLLEEVEAHQRPEGRAALTEEEKQEAALRQGLALELLTNHATPTQQSRVATWLDAGRIWQPWRAARLLALRRGPAALSTVEAVLDAAPWGYGGAQAALSLAETGAPATAERLERFLRTHYGRQGYASGKAALKLLARAGPEARAAVIAAAFRLLRHREAGTATYGGLSIDLTHPGRIVYLQTTAIEILREVGDATTAEELERNPTPFAEPTPARLRYLEESLEELRAGGDG